MPSESFTARPGPFGRVLARPEPEIENFRNPYLIRGSIGTNGANERRDVAKMESLLGRTGALDLGETDGVTGYFGPRVDEAVRRFQAARGLKMDGVVNPGGETMRTLAQEAGGAFRSVQEAVPEKRIAPADPRREAVRRGVERLRQMQRDGIDPVEHFRARRLAAAGTDKGDGDAAPGTPKPAEADKNAETRAKLREIVDALKDRTDPRAGDIDSDELEKALPDRATKTTTEKRTAPDTPILKHESASDKKPIPDPGLDPKDRAIINIIDNILGLLLLRRVGPKRLLREPNLQFINRSEEPEA